MTIFKIWPGREPRYSFWCKQSIRRCFGHITFDSIVLWLYYRRFYRFMGIFRRIFYISMVIYIWRITHIYFSYSSVLFKLQSCNFYLPLFASICLYLLVFACQLVLLPAYSILPTKCYIYYRVYVLVTGLVWVSQKVPMLHIEH